MPANIVARRVAPLVWHQSRLPIPPRAEAHMINNGDVTTIIFRSWSKDVHVPDRPAGQLWERVAEAADASELGRHLSAGGL